MKGLVLELRDGLAAVLREDGQVVTSAMACQVGETVELPADVIPFTAGTKAKSTRSRWARSLVAAALALAVIGGGYSYNTAVACSYVSVDAADTSIELVINRRGQVIDVRAVDEDSVILAQELSRDLLRMPVDEALGVTMDTMELHGLLDNSEEPMVIGIMADNKKRGAALDAAVEQFEAEHKPAAPVYTVDVTPQERQDAARQQQSGGRYAYEKQNPAPIPKAEQNAEVVEPQSAGSSRQPEPSAQGAGSQGTHPASVARSAANQTAPANGGGTRPPANQTTPANPAGPALQPQAGQESSTKPSSQVSQNGTPSAVPSQETELPSSSQQSASGVPSQVEQADGNTAPCAPEQSAETLNQGPSEVEQKEPSPKTEEPSQGPNQTNQPAENELPQTAGHEPTASPAAQSEGFSAGQTPAAQPQNGNDASSSVQRENGAGNPQGQSPEANEGW